MSLRVEQDCPQCGGPIGMEETNRLLRCSFCNVQSFLANTGPLHFILPRRLPDPFTIYAPYLRFKGTVYSCLGNRIEYRLADISVKGVALPFLPFSLGLRPQAMPMRFATPELPGTVLKNTTPTAEVLKQAAKNKARQREAILHQAFVGESSNIIYLPLSIRDEKILDGVDENTLAHLPEDGAPFADTAIDRNGWRPVFLPALCPQCGWNLAGEPDSVVLLCSNCNRGWQAGGRGFAEVRVKVTAATDKNVLFLPFWSYQVSVRGAELKSFADFLRSTNQPLVIKPDWEKMPLAFMIPAFKVRPKDFLRLATQMTISQRYRVAVTDAIPAGSLHPVTLAAADADRCLKVVLANSAVSRSAIFPFLADMEFTVDEYSLHYLPFAKTSHELQQPDLGLTINQRVLGYGRSL